MVPSSDISSPFCRQRVSNGALKRHFKPFLSPKGSSNSMKETLTNSPNSKISGKTCTMIFIWPLPRQYCWRDCVKLLINKVLPVTGSVWASGEQVINSVRHAHPSSAVINHREESCLLKVNSLHLRVCQRAKYYVLFVNAIGDNHLDGLGDLEVLWPRFWISYWKVICPGKHMYRRTNRQRNEFCPVRVRLS